MEYHNAAVAEITAQIRGFRSRGIPYRIYHGTPNTTRNLVFQHDRVVDISRLSNVLRIDRATSVALVEPSVTMDALVNATLKYGLVPPVVMEFPSITVGGSFAGSAAGSSSFKYGRFDNTINWIEVVMADGDIVIASSTERTDLFYTAAASLGSLGIVTLLEIQLIPAKKYVMLHYYPVTSVSDAKRKIEDAANDRSVEYIDGILYSKYAGVVITGKLTDSPHVRVQRFTRRHDPWFYLHVKNITIKTAPPKFAIETIPLVDYLFRYDRGAFWTGATIFQYFLIPFNWFTRWLADSLIRTGTMYRKLHERGHVQQMIIQDVIMPGSTAEDFIDWSDKILGIYPIWLCPLRPDEHRSLHPHGTPATTANKSEGELILNIGVWGPAPHARNLFMVLNRKLGRALRRHMKPLSVHAYYTKEELWRLYKSGVTTLLNVCEKVGIHVDNQKRVLADFRRTWPWRRFVEAIVREINIALVILVFKSGDCFLEAESLR